MLPYLNKLAKARKMRIAQAARYAQFEKFGPGNFWVNKFGPKILRKMKKN